MRTVEDLERELDRCTDCGLCLAACPTFAGHRDEGDSPRGRVHLTRRLLGGPPDPVAQAHLSGCLECGACHAPCPTGLRFGTARRAHRRLRDPGIDLAAFTRRASELDGALALDPGAGLTVRACEVLLGLGRQPRSTGSVAQGGLLPLIPVLLRLAAPDLTRRIDRVLRTIPGLLVDPELAWALDQASGLLEDAGLFDDHDRALAAVRGILRARQYEQVTVAAFDGVALRLRGADLPPEISVAPAPEALTRSTLAGVTGGAVADTSRLSDVGVAGTVEAITRGIDAASAWAPLTRDALAGLAPLVDQKRRWLDGRVLLTGDARSLVRFEPSVHEARLLVSMLERSHR